MADICTHIVITLIVHDGCPGGMSGFAAIGRLPASDLERIKAAESPTPTQWIADFWSASGHYDDRYLSDETVAEIFNKPVAELVSRGRQKLAEHNDDVKTKLAERQRCRDATQTEGAQ